MKTRAFTLVLLLPLAFVLSACPSQQPIITQPTTTATEWFQNGRITDIYSNTNAADLDLSAFLYLGMQDVYYWRSRVPLNLTLSSFPTPDSLLKFTKASPEDRFSTIIQDGVGYYNRLTMGTQSPIFGFGSAFVNPGVALITRVVSGSSAAQAGLKRGQRIISLDGAPVPAELTTWTQMISNLGATTTMVVENSDGSRRTASLMRTVFNEQVVPLVRTYTVAGKKVGYLIFTSFTQNAAGELGTAFASLKNESITELVLDLRYNGGGSVSTVGALCSNIASQLAGTVYARLVYNNRYATANNQQFVMQSQPNGLALNRLFVITTPATASASEMTINALRPYITVKTVGTTSYGKPVGSNIVIHKKSGYMLLPISFAYTNALGQADFVNGFAPDIPAVDDLTRDFGDPQEASLKAALYYIETGRAPVASKETSQITASKPSIFDPGAEPVPAFILPKR